RHQALELERLAGGQVALDDRGGAVGVHRGAAGGPGGGPRGHRQPRAARAEREADAPLAHLLQLGDERRLAELVGAPWVEAAGGVARRELAPGVLAVDEERLEPHARGRV